MGRLILAYAKATGVVALGVAGLGVACAVVGAGMWLVIHHPTLLCAGGLAALTVLTIRDVKREYFS